MALPYIFQNVPYFSGSSSAAIRLIMSMALRTTLRLITLMPSVAWSTSLDTLSGSESESTTPTRKLSHLGTMSWSVSEMKTRRTYSLRFALAVWNMS